MMTADFALAAAAWLLAAHWLGDFVLQTHWQATNKSKRSDALLRHVASYTAVLTAALILLCVVAFWMDYLLLKSSGEAVWIGLGLGVVNASLHYATDYFTSRWTARLWQQARTHAFFVAIGVDQMIHQTCLLGTIWLLAK